MMMVKNCTHKNYLHKKKIKNKKSSITIPPPPPCFLSAFFAL